MDERFLGIWIVSVAVMVLSRLNGKTEEQKYIT